MDNHSNSNSNSNSNIDKKDKKDKKERAHHSLPAKYAKFIHFGYFLMNKLNPPNDHDDQDEHDDHDEHDDDADNHDYIQQDKLDTNFKHFLNTLRIFDSVSNQIALVQEFFDSENTVEKDIHNLIIAHKNAINLALQSTTSSPDIFAMPKLSFFRNRTGKIDVSISAAGKPTSRNAPPSLTNTPLFSQSSKQGSHALASPVPSLANMPLYSQSTSQSYNQIPSFTSHSSNTIPSKQDTFSTQSASQSSTSQSSTSQSSTSQSASQSSTSQSFNPADIQAQIQAHIQAQIQAHIQAQIQAHIQAHIDSFNQKLADNISLHNSIQSQSISNNSNHDSIKTAELSSKHQFVPIKIKKINTNLQQQQLHTSSTLHQDITQSIPHDSIHACIFLFNNTKYLIDDTQKVYDFFYHTHIGHLHNQTIFLL
jgi:hypothetical protein